MRLLRWGVGVLGLLTLPFAVFTLYLSWSRDSGASSSLAGDIAGISVSVLAGAAFVWILPVEQRTRLLAMLGYSPMAAAALVPYGFVFVCEVLGRCL